MSVPGADSSLILFDNPPCLTKWQTFTPNVSDCASFFLKVVVVIKNFFFLFEACITIHCKIFVLKLAGWLLFYFFFEWDTSRKRSFLFILASCCHTVSLRLLSSQCHCVCKLVTPGGTVHQVHACLCYCAPSSQRTMSKYYYNVSNVITVLHEK